MRRLGLACVLLILLPAVALAWLRLGTDDSLSGVTDPSIPVLTSPSPRTIITEQPVTLSLTWEPGPSLFAPNWIGTVTGAFIEAGSKLQALQPIVEVGGILRIGVDSEKPFYRPLQRGDEGTDVLALNELLLRLGFHGELPDDPQVYGFFTAEAVKVWATSLGLTDPSGVFDPSWVVWLPEPSLDIATTYLQVGASAVPPGQPIADTLPTLVAAVVSMATGTPQPNYQEGVEYVVVLQPGTSVAFDPSSGAVPPDALERLSASVAYTETTVDGTLRPAKGLNVLTIPATAVQTNASGDLCVWAEAENGYQPVSVVLGPSSAGLSNITAGIEIGSTILANATAVLEDASCP